MHYIFSIIHFSIIHEYHFSSIILFRLSLLSLDFPLYSLFVFFCFICNFCFYLSFIWYQRIILVDFTEVRCESSNNIVTTLVFKYFIYSVVSKVCNYWCFMFDSNKINMISSKYNEFTFYKNRLNNPYVLKISKSLYINTTNNVIFSLPRFVVSIESFPPYQRFCLLLSSTDYRKIGFF